MSFFLKLVAGWTGLEPATSCVTGRRSNQLNYHPKKEEPNSKVFAVLVKECFLKPFILWKGCLLWVNRWQIRHQFPDRSAAGYRSII